MSRHRGLIVLLLDAVVFAICNFLLFLPYLRSGNIKLLNLVLHMGLLSACVFVFQLLLHTYETLWRYAESLEYLQLFKGLSNRPSLLLQTLSGVVHALVGCGVDFIGIGVVHNGLYSFPRPGKARGSGDSNK